MTPSKKSVAASTQWLSAGEREAWLGLMRVITKLPAVLDQQLERDADLNYFEYIVLAMLSERPDRTMRMNELAAMTNATLPRLSNVVKRLEARKLLRRKPDPTDGRFTRAILSAAGMRAVVAAAPGHVETVREFVIDAMTPTQLNALRVAAAAILDRIDPDGTTAPAVPPVARTLGSPQR
jgi:DNA-binding MarR family transcriptional regulator